MSTFKGIDTPEDLRKWLGANANIEAPAEKEVPDSGKIVAPGVGLVGGALVVIIPVKTASEINGRDWRKRSRRSGEAWKAVSRTIGPHLDLLAPFALAYHDQKALRVTFTRLGGRRMDKSNLPSATKGVEDALAFLLGADDADPRWHPQFEQSPGGDVGIRIEIEVYQ